MWHILYLQPCWSSRPFKTTWTFITFWAVHPLLSPGPWLSIQTLKETSVLDCEHTQNSKQSPTHTHTTLIRTGEPGCPAGPWLPGGPGGPCEIRCRDAVLHTSNEISCSNQCLWQDIDRRSPPLLCLLCCLSALVLLFPPEIILMPINNNQHEHAQLLKNYSKLYLISIFSRWTRWPCCTR